MMGRMRLRSLRVRGYRSLYDVTVLPGDLTILTGPNNSGKTNFVEAIDFLAEAYRHGPEVAVNRKGGIENIAHRRSSRTRRPISFEVVCSISMEEIQHRLLYETNRRRQQPDKRRLLVSHRFSIGSTSQAIEADFAITEEEITISESLPNPRSRSAAERVTEIATITRAGGEITPTVTPRLSRFRHLIGPLGDKEFISYIKSYLTNTDLLIRRFGFSAATVYFVQQFGASRLYQLVPIECRRPGVPTPNADVERHGNNLPAMVAYMHRHDPDTWRTILDAIRRILPDLEAVNTDFTPDRRLALQFVEKGVRRTWSSEDISDGTIQSLALFTVLYDKRIPLLLIEEPENSIHSWAIRNFLDSCKAVPNKQIILTTHSPSLISYSRPQNILLAWRRRGQTDIRPLVDIDQQAERLWADGETSLFELLDSGVIPQSVPGGTGE